MRTALLSSYYDELSYGISLRETLEVWRVHAGMKAASQNYASAARSVLAMWLSLNLGSVPRRKPDFASDCSFHSPHSDQGHIAFDRASLSLALCLNL